VSGLCTHFLKLSINWHVAVILSAFDWKSFEKMIFNCNFLHPVFLHAIHYVQLSNPTKVPTLVYFYNLVMRLQSVLVAQVGYCTVHNV
jgi:hypothetical protein